MKLIVSIRTMWPVIVGMGTFILYACATQHCTLSLTIICLSGPILGFQQHPSLQWGCLAVGSILFMLTPVALYRWYTFILAMLAAFFWCFMGLMAAGASC